MQIILFSANQNIIDEWIQRHNIENTISCYDLNSLEKETNKNYNYILVCDYDSVAHELNALISSNLIPEYCIVLEKSPAIATGKMLISKGVKAYGNSRMQNVHFTQLLNTVIDGNIWTYPELTTALIKVSKKAKLNSDAQKLIDSRLTQKEIEVVLLILEGLTNDAIANTLEITARTVKAHISSIFQKLHVNDRISLVLLLK